MDISNIALKLACVRPKDLQVITMTLMIVLTGLETNTSARPKKYDSLNESFSGTRQTRIKIKAHGRNFSKWSQTGLVKKCIKLCSYVFIICVYHKTFGRLGKCPRMSEMPGFKF